MVISDTTGDSNHWTLLSSKVVRNLPSVAKTGPSVIGDGTRIGAEAVGALVGRNRGCHDDNRGAGKGFGKEIVVVEDQEGVGRISSPKQANPKSHAP